MFDLTVKFSVSLLFMPHCGLVVGVIVNREIGVGQVHSLLC